MLFFLISLVSANIPLGLKDLHVAISCQKYPNKVITLAQTDLIHKDIRMLELKRVDRDLLKDQIFKLQQAWSGGIVLKTATDLRSFRHFDSLKFQRFQKGIDEEQLYLLKDGVKYPRTFQIISDRKCLEAIKSMDKKRIYVKFSSCDKSDSQLWGAFTEDQVRSYLGIKPVSLDGDEKNLSRFLDQIHKKSFKQLVDNRCTLHSSPLLPDNCNSKY